MTNPSPYEVETSELAARVNNRRTAACWYVWGRQDAGDYGVDSQGFADHYAALWLAHQRGETSFLPSIQDAYATYKATPHE
jgi:hypothetical protein